MSPSVLLMPYLAAGSTVTESTCLRRSYRYGIYMPSPTAARLVEGALQHVRAAYPFWNRSGGADHLLPFTGDDGATWLRGRLPWLRTATFLTHWGWLCNDAASAERGKLDGRPSGIAM